MYALAIHGGAGDMPAPAPARAVLLQHGLSAALNAGEQVLARDGSALEAVEAAVATLEDDPAFNAGRGAVLNVEGIAELDAAIMDGTTLRAGAVAAVRRTRNPIHLARHILEQQPHVFLVGEGADRYAAELGLPLEPPSYFITAARVEQLDAFRAQQRRRATPETQAPRGATAAPITSSIDLGLGTVGAVARDRHGRLAAATSTGGIVGKRVGRVGDSPVIGAGTFADDRTCAISATGHGEWLLRTVQAYDIAARLRYGGSSLRRAAEEAILERLPRLGGRGGLIGVDAAGQIVMCYNTQAMLRACVREGEARSVMVA